jgi:hypothetical protein
MPSVQRWRSRGGGAASVCAEEEDSIKFSKKINGKTQIKLIYW